MSHSSPYGPAGGGLEGSFPNPKVRGADTSVVLANAVFAPRRSLTVAATSGGSTPVHAFGAYASVTTAAGGATFTKVTFGTTEFDTDGAFASNRFTAITGGYYQINALVSFVAGTVSNEGLIVIYKNGAAYKYGTRGSNAAAVRTYCLVSAVVPLLPTDYVEIFGYSASGWSTDANQQSTWFNGFLIK